MKVGLDPLIWVDSRVLVLGSLPSDESLRVKQYYATAENQFWSILYPVFDESPVPLDYDSRVAFLRRHQVAVWDVLRSAERDGSSDARIRCPESNDIRSLLEVHPDIDVIALNGRAAEALFRRLLAPTLDTGSLRIEYVPSSSSTPGRHVLPLPAKIAAWKQVIESP